MKLKAFIVGMSLLSLNAFAAEALPPVDALPTAYPIQISNPTYTVEGHNGFAGGTWLTIEVSATVTFSNECMAPEQIVKEYLVNSEGAQELRVLGVNNQARMCPRIYLPVSKTILVDRIHTSDIMPVIKVNGTVAKHLQK